MRKFILLIALSGATITGLRAQVGIGTKTPDKAAQLEIASDPTTPGARGLLIPRVNLTSIDMALGGVAKSEMPNSVLVFNTNKNLTDGTKTYGVGYYYWATDNGSAKGNGKWVPLLAGSAGSVQNFFNTVNTNSSTVTYDNTTNSLKVNVNNGLKENVVSGKTYIGLGGSLTENTTITLGTHDLILDGLKGKLGASTDYLVTLEPSTGKLKSLQYLSLDQVATSGTADNNKVLKVVGGKAKWVDLVGSGTAGLINAGNGLTFTGNTVELGGTLSRTTVITTDATKTLAIKGLSASTNGTDKLMVLDNNGVLKQADGVKFTQIKADPADKGKILAVDNAGTVTWTTIGGKNSSVDYSGLAGDGLTYNTTSKTLSVQAENGITVEDDKVKLGGALTKATEITTSTGKTLAIKGLEATEAGTDKIVVVDPTSGVLKRVDGVKVSQISAKNSSGNADANKGKVLTVDNTTGNVEWKNLADIGGNSNGFSELAGEGLKFNVGTKKIDVQAQNGVIVDPTSHKVELGGPLTKTATIETDTDKGFEIKPKGGAGNSNVVIKELPDGTVTDAFVVVGADGKLKKVDPKTAAKINYTSEVQETGRKWTLPATTGGPAQDKKVKEVTFDVTFDHSSTVDIFTVLHPKDSELNAGDKAKLMPVSIRAISATGSEISVTQSGSYDSSNGKLTLGMSGNGFTVAHNGKYFIVLEYYVK